MLPNNNDPSVLTNNAIDDAEEDGEEDEVPLPIKCVHNSWQTQEHKDDCLTDVGHHLHGVFCCGHRLFVHIRFHVVTHCDAAKRQPGRGDDKMMTDMFVFLTCSLN